MRPFAWLILLTPLFSLQSLVQEEECSAEISFDQDPHCDPEKGWYAEFKPGYFYFMDSDMRHFFGNGGFTFRGEAGYKFRIPLMIWVDGGYFWKEGKAIGGEHTIDFKLATLTLGLKGICYLTPHLALYAGAGPRLFMMMLHNDSPFVRGDDNEIGIGAGCSAGLWIFPIPALPNLFLDLFGDYSWKKMKVEEDEVSSFTSDVDVTSLTGGLGLGYRF